MPGIFLNESDPPQFLTEKIGDNSSAEEIIGTLMAMVETVGFEVVFGRILRWKVEKNARKLISEATKKALMESGYKPNFYTVTQSITLGAGRVIMCHESYIMDGGADDDVINYDLEHERERMVGIARIHEDDLATLMTPVSCVVTTTADMMSAMYGVKFKRVETEGNGHEIVIFYDDDYEAEVPKTEQQQAKRDPFAEWAEEESDDGFFEEE